MVSTIDPTYRYALHNTRLYIRIASTILLFIALILDSVSAGICGNNDRYYDGFTECISFTGLSGVPVAILWNAAEFITVRVNKKGIHPGAHIAIDLCLVGYLATAGSLDLAFSMGYESTVNNGPMAAAGVFESVTSILHFVLFVMACIGVHKWLQCSPKESSRLVQILRKMEGRIVGIPPMPPVGPVKLIRLPDSDAGLPRMLVFYVTEGELESDTETLMGTKEV